MRPSELLEAQRDLLRRFAGDAAFRDYAWRTVLGDLADGDIERIDASTVAYFADATARVVRRACAYRVSKDMSLLVQHAALQLDNEDLWDPGLAPTPEGLAYFEQPLPLRDAGGYVHKVHWIAWGPVDIDGNGFTLIYMFNDHNDPDSQAEVILGNPETGPVIREHLGRWGCVHGFVMPAGKPLGTAHLDARDRDLAVARAEDRARQALSRQVLRDMAEALAAGRVPNSIMDNPARYVHAFWLLLTQSISETTDEHVRKTVRRIAQQAGLPARVRVVALRRSEGSRRPGESTVDWAHRWVVRGHWRWQPYGPGRQQRRRTWIAPYVKGPDGKPIVVSDKVYDVR